MKKLFVIFFVLAYTNCFSQTIKGKIIDIDTKKPLRGAHIFLVDTAITDDKPNITFQQLFKYKIIKETLSDSLGKYSFKSLKEKTYTIIANYSMPETNDFGVTLREAIEEKVIIGSNTLYKRTFYLRVTCPYNKTKNQEFCPKCKKEDKVVPILYGLPHIDSNGKSSINGQPIENCYLGGCMVDFFCNATKHCNRCNKSF